MATDLTQVTANSETYLRHDFNAPSQTSGTFGIAKSFELRFVGTASSGGIEVWEKRLGELDFKLAATYSTVLRGLAFVDLVQSDCEIVYQLRSNAAFAGNVEAAFYGRVVA
jgi:hypothetical protein